ncbi:response regulator [Pseudothauera lacus]|uniref:response regulator n=1 Tax=Pseudothauera lacus TaxID=2136175 RepID=UPI0015E76B2F|nr:response regulator [Pseudothauera lacus]
MEELVGSPPREGVGILLLVDDEANIVAALRRLLRRDGYTLLSAGSGEEGLALLATQAVDVILSDQRMPGMSGVEFLRQAKILRPDTVRLVLSGYTELQSITNAINEGAIFKFLTKPWDDEQLRANIAEAFSFKRLADENRRLSTQLREANAQLERMLADKQGQIVRERRTMGVLHELLQVLPWPLLGVDEAGMVVAANAQLENLLGSAAALLGGDSDAVLPAALARFAAGGGDDETVLALCGADYRVLRRQLGERSGAAGKLLILLPEGKCDG